MDSCTSPLTYYNNHAFKTKQYLETYCSATVDKEILQEFNVYPMEKLHRVFSSEHIGRDTLIDISGGHILFQLFPVCKFFKEVIILEHNDQCIKELRKWMSNDPDAHDWSYASKLAMELDTSKSYQDIEDMLRSKVKRIVPCDLAKDNPTSPIELPKANCVLCVRTLEAISEDLNAYRRNLKNMSSLLKVGGHLILLADINASFYKIGDDKYHILNYDEGFLTKALKDEGYVTTCFETIGKVSSSDLCDLEKTVFVVAQKQ
ncbi:nicotinamide N-methyltransferase-like [Mixophyes fleayi]|uniref:nicotinamide N-methyltransferase-like n=1 Tax=Mixophyes fleayi TaxID=3061075 RepID=UPI003F4DE946